MPERPGRAARCRRRSPMKRASAPSRAGSSASSCSRTRRASTGAAPAELTATMSGERSTMAGKMKVESSASSTTLTGMPRTRAASRHRAIHRRLVGRGDDERRAVEVLGREAGGAMAQVARAATCACSSGVQLRCDHRDVRAGPGSHSALRAATRAAADHHRRLGAAVAGKPADNPWPLPVGSGRQRRRTDSRMQAAFARLRLLPPPASGAAALARLDGAGAG